MTVAARFIVTGSGQIQASSKHCTVTQCYPVVVIEIDGYTVVCKLYDSNSSIVEQPYKNEKFISFIYSIQSACVCFLGVYHKR